MTSLDDSLQLVQIYRIQSFIVMHCDELTRYDWFSCCLSLLYLNVDIASPNARVHILYVTQSIVINPYLRS